MTSLIGLRAVNKDGVAVGWFVEEGNERTAGQRGVEFKFLRAPPLHVAVFNKHSNIHTAVCYVGEMSFIRKRGDIILNNTDRRIDIGALVGCRRSI